MGGDKHQQQHHVPGFHFHLPHVHVGGRAKEEAPRKGWMAIRVGAEQQRFVVPVEYFNHPLFVALLKEAEEEYGFEQKGAIAIPCHVEHFRRVQGLIDRQTTNHHHHHHLLHLHVSCFRA